MLRLAWPARAPHRLPTTLRLVVRLPGRILACFLAGVATLAFAHHGYDAAYDGARLITVEGRIVQFAIENPHSRIVIEVVRTRGGVDTWTVETVPATRATQLNHPLIAADVKPGDKVRVMGWPARDGSPRLGGHKLVLADGREIMLRPAITLPPRGN